MKAIPMLGTTPLHHLGYGAMRLPGVRGTAEDVDLACVLLREAVTLGANVIDTAAFYGAGLANTLIAKALRPYADNLVVATKVGVALGADDRPVPAASPREIRMTIRSDLDTLGVSSLNLVFLRLAGGPLADSGVSLQESMACLAALKDNGIIKHIGLSSASLEQLQAAQAVAPVDAVQNAFFIGNQQSRDVLDKCTADGIPFFAYFPLGMGRLIQQKVDLGPLAQAHRATTSQIALAWLLARSPVMLPIPGTSNLEHLRNNMRAVDIVLSRDEIDYLNNVN